MSQYEKLYSSIRKEHIYLEVLYLRSSNISLMEEYFDGGSRCEQLRQQEDVTSCIEVGLRCLCC